MAAGKTGPAFQLYARAGRTGLAEAEYRVGRCYLDGVGVPPSRAGSSKLADLILVNDNPAFVSSSDSNYEQEPDPHPNRAGRESACVRGSTRDPQLDELQ